MSVSSIQSTVRTTSVNPQQDAPFSIADNTMPAGGGGDCGDLRRNLFKTILSAIAMDIAESDDRFPSDVQRTNTYNSLETQLSGCKDCDNPEDGDLVGRAQHSVIQAFSRSIGAGLGPEDAIGDIVEGIERANEEQPAENRMDLAEIEQALTRGGALIGGLAVWIFQQALPNPGYAH